MEFDYFSPIFLRLINNYIDKPCNIENDCKTIKYVCFSITFKEIMPCNVFCGIRKGLNM